MTVIDIKTKIPVKNSKAYSKEKEYEIQYEKIRKSITQTIEIDADIKYANKKAIRIVLCLFSLLIYSFFLIYSPSDFAHVAEILFIMVVQIIL
jgi:hypothetical protein